VIKRSVHVSATTNNYKVVTTSRQVEGVALPENKRAISANKKKGVFATGRLGYTFLCMTPAIGDHNVLPFVLGKERIRGLEKKCNRQLKEGDEEREEEDSKFEKELTRRIIVLFNYADREKERVFGPVLRGKRGDLTTAQRR
jgi:hypothetical protein